MKIIENPRKIIKEKKINYKKQSDANKIKISIQFILIYDFCLISSKIYKKTKHFSIRMVE